MKTLLIILFSTSVFANSSLQECTEKGADYYSTESIQTQIPTDCGKLIEDVKTKKTSAINNEGTIQISAFKNIIYINDNGVDRFIAGNLTRVHNVISLVFVEAESRIYVLNENPERQKEVLSFIYNISGNVSPIRSLETYEIENATGISIEEDHIHVTSSTHDWKKVFHKNADPNGKKPENGLGIIREVSGKFDL